MSELPNGWANAKIGELCDLVNGRAFKPSDWTGSGLPIVRIQNLNNHQAPFNNYNGEVKDKFRIKDGELLFAWSGTPGTSFGAHIWDRGEAVLNQHIFKVEFAEDLIDKQYLRYAINQKLQYLIDIAHGGVGLRHVTKGKFEDTVIPLPPTKEQQRIVAKLNSLFERTGRAREELSHIPLLIDHYKQAILAVAFRGDLTADWREENAETVSGEELRRELLAQYEISLENSGKGRRKKTEPLDLSAAEQLPRLPEAWTWMSVSKLATKVVDGVHKKPSYVENGIPFLTVKNLTAGPGVSFYDCKYVSESDHNEYIKRTPPQKGDILISKDGTLGVVRAVRTDRIFSVFVSVALVKPVDYGMTDYLEYAFQSPQVQGQMVGVGTGLQHIHLTDLRRDLIPISPERERAEIVRRVAAALESIDKIAFEADRASMLIDHLDQANLARAFRGEIVPQDPNDEPASVLLARIREQRAAQPTIKRSRRKKLTTRMK